MLIKNKKIIFESENEEQSFNYIKDYLYNFYIKKENASELLKKIRWNESIRKTNGWLEGFLLEAKKQIRCLPKEYQLLCVERGIITDFGNALFKVTYKQLLKDYAKKGMYKVIKNEYFYK